MSTEPAVNEGAVAAPHDPYLYDTEQLRTLAGELVLRNGLEYFKQNRVMELYREPDPEHPGQGYLWGQVEGSRADTPYETELGVDGNGALQVRCDCDAEPGTVCKHAVAVLYAYAARQSADDQGGMLGSAVDNAIEERTRKGRTEVRVEHIDGSPWFGTWRAASITSTTHHRRHYRVQLRSLTRRWNYCTCPDFAINQLGTCKHIEAVLHKVSKRPDYARLKRQPAPMSYVYLAWDSADAPRIRLHRSAALEADLGAVLERWFDAAGEFAGRLPDDYFRFTEEVDERDDIHLGEDAEELVRRLAEDAAQHRRAAGIRDQIVRSGGQLDGVRARLYPYQVEGVAFLAANGRALLADDMGLGKTLQAIAASVWLLRNAAVKHILIVCPASLKQQWAREIQRFSGQTVEVIQGNAEARAAQYRREASFFVANYELVLRDLSYINTDLAPDLLILDEAQRIKNWRTKIASTIKLIPSRYAFVLTGTPWRIAWRTCIA